LTWENPVSGIVVDTSVWIDYFAGEEMPLLDGALKQGAVMLPPIVVAELISGAYREKDRSALIEFFEALPLCEANREHWIRVGELRRKCREKGLSISTPDAHVAQCALDLDALLLSRDHIFTRLVGDMRLRLFP
jgi:predicted nucleic acid-binding protein